MYLRAGTENTSSQKLEAGSTIKEDGCVQFRVEDDRADALLVVGEGGHGTAGGQVPQADGTVVAAGDDLRFRRLADDRRHRVCVPDQCMNVGLRFAISPPSSSACL